jgi:hypothetical protein
MTYRPLTVESGLCRLVPAGKLGYLELLNWSVGGIQEPPANKGLGR